MEPEWVVAEGKKGKGWKIIFRGNSQEAAINWTEKYVDKVNNRKPFKYFRENSIFWHDNQNFDKLQRYIEIFPDSK